MDKATLINQKGLNSVRAIIYTLGALKPKRAITPDDNLDLKAGVPLTLSNMTGMQFKRSMPYECQLGSLYLRASNEEITLDELLRASQQLRAQIVEEDPDGWNDPSSYQLLKEGLEMAHQLHDRGEQDFYRQNPQQLHEAAERLLGTKPVQFPPIPLPNKLEVIVRYTATSEA